MRMKIAIGALSFSHRALDTFLDTLLVVAWCCLQSHLLVFRKFERNLQMGFRRS